MAERKYPKKLIDAMKKNDPFSLYYFEGAVSGGLKESEQLEKALGVEETYFRHRMEQFDQLLEQLSQLDLGDDDA